MQSVDLAQEFEILANQWRNQTATLSSITKMVKHPAYQKIIAMGWSAVPLILRELETEPDHWFYALYTITGENPVSPNSNFDQAVAAWRQWGEDKGLL